MKLLTVKDIMEQYSVGKETATLWAKAAGTAPRVKGGKIFVSDEVLEKYLKG